MGISSDNAAESEFKHPFAQTMYQAQNLNNLNQTLQF
jgi:hypothetical protein